MSEAEWMMLSRLCERRMSVRDALEEMCRMYPGDHELREMRKKLAEGKTIAEALGKGAFERQLGFYCLHLPFVTALQVMLKQHRQRKKLSADMISSVGYQLVLGICALLLLTLFSSVLFPRITDMLEIDRQLVSGAAGFLRVLLIARNVILTVIILLILIISHVLIFRRQLYAWMYLHRLNMDGAIRKAVTYRFAGKLLILLKSGCDLHRSLDIMRLQLDQPLEGLLAHDLNESLLQGKDFESGMKGSFFDRDFHHLCLYGLKGDDLTAGLEDYLAITGLQIERQLKRAGYGIQAFCYIFIALVMLCGYQILMLPLELLEGG